MQWRHTARRAWFSVLEGAPFERDLGPFLRGAIDAHQATMRAGGFQGYRPLGSEGVRHERLVRGSDPTRAGEILPWSHKIFGNRKTWVRGTLHRVILEHL